MLGNFIALRSILNPFFLPPISKFMIKNLKDVESFLYKQILPNKNKFPGEYGLLRIKKFLTLLDNPQNKLSVVHIAGTSGKGSTAYFTSLILEGQGFKTGLSLSPHVIDFRERFQVNNQLLSEQAVVKYFNDILPYIETFNKSDFGPISYFEILISFAFYIFYKEKVDFAVIETGLGGLYDGTNCVNKREKNVILTKIGIDHKEILGNTIAKVSYQKGGIIHTHNQVISIDQKNSAKKVIEKIIKKNSATLAYIKNGINYKLRSQSSQFLIFDFDFENLKIKNIKLNTPAIYQIENCSLALAVVSKLAKQFSFSLSKEKIIKSLSKSNFIGRMETLYYKKRKIILDGAHNPQKMAAFTKSLRKAYPYKKFDFIVSFKKGKDYKKMLNYIFPLANKIYLTDFNRCNQDFIITSELSENIIQYLSKKELNNWEIVSDPKLAIKKSFQKESPILVITGSLYLISSIYSFVSKK